MRLYTSSMRSKYGNKKIKYNGEVFDSRKEARRWCELLLLQKAGDISELKRQVEFEIIPAQYEIVKRVSKTGKPLKDGKKLVERRACYVADFVYRDKEGNIVVEDTKSEATKTKDYILKRKLMLFVHDVRIKEI